MRDSAWTSLLNLHLRHARSQTRHTACAHGEALPRWERAAAPGQPSRRNDSSLAQRPRLMWPVLAPGLPQKVVKVKVLRVGAAGPVLAAFVEDGRPRVVAARAGVVVRIVEEGLAAEVHALLAAVGPHYQLLRATRSRHGGGQAGERRDRVRVCRVVARDGLDGRTSLACARSSGCCGDGWRSGKHLDRSDGAMWPRGAPFDSHEAVPVPRRVLRAATPYLLPFPARKTRVKVAQAKFRKTCHATPQAPAMRAAQCNGCLPHWQSLLT